MLNNNVFILEYDFYKVKINEEEYSGLDKLYQFTSNEYVQNKTKK